MTTNKIQMIHEKALLTARRYKALEVELIDILQQVDQNRVFYRYGYSSLFRYSVDCLKLSEAVAYMFISVARKSKEIPELKAEIKNGNISISKAKKISSVLTPQNKEHWLNLAKSSTQAKIEKEVASVSPSEAVRSQMTYVNPGLEVSEKVRLKAQSAVRVQLQVGISEKLMLKIRRAQDIVSQKKRSAASLEQVLEEAMKLYIEKHDPVERAKRQIMRKGVGQVATIQVDEVNPPLGDCFSAKYAKGTSVHVKSVDVEDVRRSYIKGKDIKDRASLKTIAPRVATTSSVDPTSQIELQFLRPVKTINTDKPMQSTSVKNKSKVITSQPRRKSLPAHVKHQLFLKTQGRCAHVSKDGDQCVERRFLDVHHIQPLARGGGNHLENLTLLCSGHHRAEHVKPFAQLDTHIEGRRRTD